MLLLKFVHTIWMFLWVALIHALLFHTDMLVEWVIFVAFLTFIAAQMASELSQEWLIEKFNKT